MKFVFDLGGVLLRWQPAELLQRLLPAQAHDAASAALWVQRFFQGYGGDWGEFDRGTLDADALVPRIAARTGLGVDEVRRVVDAVPQSLQPLPDSVALLRRLHDTGRELYFLSNMPTPYAAIVEPREDFFACFRGGIFSCREGLIKPEPAIYALAQQRFGAEAQALVFLDDHGPNVLAARAAGWQALQFTDAARAEAEMRVRGWV